MVKLRCEYFVLGRRLHLTYPVVLVSPLFVPNSRKGALSAIRRVKGYELDASDMLLLG